MIKVVDNFFSPVLIELLTQELQQPYNPWSITPTAIEGDHLSFGINPQPHSEDNDNPNPEVAKHLNLLSYYMASEIADKFQMLDISRLWRIRYGLIHRDKEKLIHKPHIDYDGAHYTALLHIAGDGETYFYEKDKKTVMDTIEFKPNRLTLFDGTIWHSSSTPVENQLRFACNYNFGVK